MRVKIVVDSDSEGADYEEINDPMATLNRDSVPAVQVAEAEDAFPDGYKIDSISLRCTGEIPRQSEAPGCSCRQGSQMYIHSCSVVIWNRSA